MFSSGDSGSLSDSITYLSNTSTIPTIQDYINLIEQYGSLFSGVDSEDLLLYANKFQKNATGAQYALQMLLDIPATVEILQDIIERRESDPTKKIEQFRGLDLGSGSGILSLAMYIRAKRLGYADPDISIIGAEIMRESVRKSHEILNTVSKSINIILADTTYISSTHSHAPVSFICNENIPNPLVPFYYNPKIHNFFAQYLSFGKKSPVISDEPFFFNLEHFHARFDIMENTEYFPHIVEIGEVYLQNKKLTLKNNTTQTIKTGNIPYLDKNSIGKFSRSAPIGIGINEYIQRLEDIGNSTIEAHQELKGFREIYPYIRRWAP